MSIEQIHNWFVAATPQDFTQKQYDTQLGVHFEEVSEMLEAVTGLDEESQREIEAAHAAIKRLADVLKTGKVNVKVSDPEGLLDSVCDQVVTAVGVGTLSGMDVSGALQHVADSNDSKFVDGQAVRHPETQKIMKGPNYFAPDLSPFVNKGKFSQNPG